ncbi:hypothetical protein CYCD_30560 [Tenuifilaceae bacterium CYCD]|nr:hypothetical protein CYCD_30560 [Tenuifilaceae bacterium CYCD]
MILILSETLDITTDRVIDWLHSFGYKDVLRINEGTPIYVKHISIGSTKSEIILCANNRVFNIEEVCFYWYRRGLFSFDILPSIDLELNSNLDKLLWFHKNEWYPIRNYIINKFELKPHIGNLHKSISNKIINLEIARACGLKIPQTSISNYSEILRQQMLDSKEYICKPVSEFIDFVDTDYEYSTFTRKLSTEELLEPSHYSSPQLIQEYIDKWIELRVFILKDKVFSMAIFSQKYQDTSVDFRAGDLDSQYRVAPFELPDEITQKLLQFMSNAGLDNGSLDLILTNDGEYIFLEVNPIGIIDMVSKPCNYHIEREIALQIIQSIDEA